MTKEEAIYWMKLGARCIHKFIGTGEWVTIDEIGLYVLEDGLRCTPNEFWEVRVGECWEDNWEFADGYDPYVCIAAREYRCPISEVTPTMRMIVKNSMFPIMYC